MDRAVLDKFRRIFEHRSNAGHLALCVPVAALAGLVLLSSPLMAQTSTGTSTSPAQTVPAKKPIHHAHKPVKPVVPEPAPVIPVAPPPELPKWPVNDAAGPASVVLDSRGLRIDASNSSLQAILKEVSTETGVKVEGLSGDERIYGVYGPGRPRDVLTQLLNGSAYNVLMIGDQGQGSPRELVLTARQTGPAQPAVRNNANNEEDDVEEPPAVVEPPVQPNMPPTNRPPGAPNGGPPRTPQQIMQEMQQRQQQVNPPQN
jgi:hypothetical protein